MFACARRNLLAAVLAALSVFLAPTGAWGQDYPAKVVRVIVPFAPGGGSDITARQVAQKLSEQFKRQFVVDNRGGASGLIGMELTAKAPPDGYTIMVMSGSFAATPATHKPAFDPINTIIPVAEVGFTPFVLSVHPTLPVKTARELIALANARPGQLNYASAGTGTYPHMTMELLLSMARIKMVHIPYKGTAPAMIDMLAGQVATMAATVLTGMPHIRSGRLRPLGITSTARASVAPEIPTVAEAGLPGYESVQWYGMLAPAKTPREIVNRLYTEVSGVLKQPEIKTRLANDGADTVGSSPDEFTRYIQSELVKWAKVARDAGIQPE